MGPLTTATVAVNLLMGLVYVAYGLITIVDLRTDSATKGSSHLAYGFIAIMLTCGPHHIDHGLHLATGSDAAGVMDLVTVALGLPAGIAWFLLRLEAARGGRGDRVLDRNTFIEVLRNAAAIGLVLVVATVLSTDVGAAGWTAQLPRFRLLPNVLIMVMYVAIAVILLRTQLRRQAVDGSWSLSGLSLTGVFASCAAMHAVWIGYVASGRYTPDTHLLIIDLIAVPATAYFLAVIWLITDGRLTDSTERAGDVTSPTSPERVGTR